VAAVIYLGAVLALTPFFSGAGAAAAAAIAALAGTLWMLAAVPTHLPAARAAAAGANDADRPVGTLPIRAAEKNVL
jgi:hypothetical protein